MDLSFYLLNLNQQGKTKFGQLSLSFPYIAEENPKCLLGQQLRFSFPLGAVARGTTGHLCSGSPRRRERERLHCEPLTQRVSC